MDARRSSSNLNVALSHFVLLARKFKTALIVIVQDKDIVDLRARGMANVFVHRENKKKAHITEIFDKEVNYSIVNITLTRVIYDTYDVAAFALSEEVESKKKGYNPFSTFKK